MSRSRLIHILLVASTAFVTSCVQVVGPPSVTLAPGQSGPPPASGWIPPASSTPPAGSTPTAGSTAPAGPGPAFIAYVREDNIWAIAPDGSTPLQLTSDGASEAYHDPAVAPDGTVYALRGKDKLYHLDLTPRVLTAPATLAVLENGAEGLSIGPDGAHLAVVTTGWGTLIDPRFGSYAGQFIYGGTDVMTPDGLSVPGAAMGQMLYPSWAGPSTLVLSDGTIIYVDSVPAPEPSAWLYVSDGCLIPEDCASGQEPMAHFAEAVVNRAGTVVAYDYRPYFGTAGRRMLSLAGPPPADATVRCLIEGQENYRDPGSFSTDGSLFTFDDTVFDPDSLETIVGQGIYVMNVDLNATDCGASSARLIVPGGFQPDFSNAR